MMKVNNAKLKVSRFLSVQAIGAFCLLLAVCGCGYTIHGTASLPFDSIQIGKIENKTLEPKLQDMLYRALTEEFLKEGISVQAHAGHKLSGTINKFDLKVLSEKSNVAAEYEIVMRGDFKLVDPSGKAKDFKRIGSPFIVSFAGSGSLNELIANKELASEKAIRDMAMEIVAALLYR
jgi:Lipopolysaccharide-assembly